MNVPLLDMAPAQADQAAKRPWLRRYLLPVLLAAAAILAAFVAAESLLGRLHKEEERTNLARAEASAGVVQQLALRRIEAADVLHRLAQSWFTLWEKSNWEGAAAQEEHLAATANAGSFGIVQVALIGADGWMEWSSISGRASRVYLGDREHFRVHADGRREMFVSEPVLGRVSQRWALQLTRPLLDAAGRFGGVVVVSLDLYNLSEAMADVHPAPSDRSLLLRGDGLIVAHSQDAPGLIGRSLPAADPLVQRPPQRDSGSLLRLAPGGSTTAVGWRRLPGTGLTASYELDEWQSEGALAPVSTAVRLAALAFALMAVSVAAIWVLLGERRAARLAAERADSERRLADMARRVFETRIAGLPAVVYGGEISRQRGFRLGHVSESLKRITGWAPAGIGSGEDWLRLAETITAEEHAAFLGRVLADGQGTREYRLRRPEGPSIWVRDHLRVVERNADGSAEAVGYLRDITGERDVEMKAQIAGRLATLGEMATGLAHELNQPLAVMSLAADNSSRALEQRGAQAIPDVLKRLDRIARQSTRARDIVDHLRLFGRRQEAAPPVAIDLDEAVRGALVLTGAALRAGGIRVETDLPADLPRVLGSLVPLEQAMVNLLLNARDAIEEAGRSEGVIRIAGERRGEDVVLSIADNGGGIPETAMKRLFEPFFTTKPPGKGTGLGLTICHTAMKSFGGEIEAANDGEGARFTLVFRLAPDQRLPGQTPSLTAEAQSAP